MTQAPTMTRPASNKPGSSRSWWALGLSLVPTFVTQVVAIVLACQVLARQQLGRGRAAAALVISALWIVGALAGLVVWLLQPTGNSTAHDTTQPVASTQPHLHVGDCVESLPTEGMTSRAQTVLCGSSHFAEVFATYDLKDATYPGQAQASQQAVNGCRNRLAAIEKKHHAFPGIEMGVLYPPDEVTFQADAGVTCLGGVKTALTHRLFHF